MKTKLQTLLLGSLLAALAACGGRDSDSSGQSAAGDETRTAPATAGAEAPPAPAAGEEARPAQTDAPDAGAADLALPDGVTMAMVDDGKAIFSGRGICVTCHGPDASGIPNLGGNLTDDEWIHSDGSYDGIVQTIMDGVSVEASTVRLPMPPRGGASISDDEVKSVAAYVWTLSR